MGSPLASGSPFLWQEELVHLLNADIEVGTKGIDFPLLAGLALLPPAPAEAQTTAWSATLTVDDSSGDRGCDNLDRTFDNCSDEQVLSDDKFDYANTTYRIVRLFRSGNFLYFRTDRTLPSTILERAPLTADGNCRLPFSRFTRVFSINPRYLRVSNPGFTWSDNQVVTLSIMARAPLPVYLRTEPGDERVTLYWHGVDEARGYQYRVLDGNRIVKNDWFSASYGTTYQYPHPGGGTRLLQHRPGLPHRLEPEAAGGQGGVCVLLRRDTAGEHQRRPRAEQGGQLELNTRF